jgi:predicted amidohydrolase
VITPDSGARSQEPEARSQKNTNLTTDNSQLTTSPCGGIEFWGGSFVYDPFGRLLQRASNDKEEVIIVDCDPKKSETTRQHWPFLRDRRIDAYGPIVNRAID